MVYISNCALFRRENGVCEIKGRPVTYTTCKRCPDFVEDTSMEDISVVK